MDFGGFIAFIGLCWLCIALIILNIYAKVKNKDQKLRRQLFAGLVGCMLLIFISGRWLYHVYFVDEALVDVAGSGDIAQAKDLLDRGGDPNDVFEGENAMDAALESGSKEMIDLIRKAGGKPYRAHSSPIDSTP